MNVVSRSHNLQSENLGLNPNLNKNKKSRREIGYVLEGLDMFQLKQGHFGAEEALANQNIPANWSLQVQDSGQEGQPTTHP
jgi:hypothetical protein